MSLIKDTETTKTARGDGYNFCFDKRDGWFARCGTCNATPEQFREESETAVCIHGGDGDPQWSPDGPELLDLEISVNGCPNNCKFCYKGNNNSAPTNMTLDTFKAIMDRMPPSVTQIAFGITGVQTNPDFIPMLIECRRRGVIPNFTLSGIDLTPELAEEIAKHVGALAVSLYENDLDTGLKAIQMFKDLGMEQVNVHLLVATERMPFILRLFEEWIRVPTSVLRRVNAFVLLGVKPKGRAAKGNFNPLPMNMFRALVEMCLRIGIPIGFDSCSAPKFEAAVKQMRGLTPEQMESMLRNSESCESGLFSSYIDVNGVFHVCSFAEGVDWTPSIPVLDHESFLEGIWLHPEVVAWREKLLATAAADGCRRCPIYQEIHG